MDTLAKSALNCSEAYGQPGLSAFGGEGMTAVDVIRSVDVLASRSSFRETTAGELYNAGFTIEKTRGPLHFTIWLPDDSDGTLLKFESAWGPVERNPLVQDRA